MSNFLRITKHPLTGKYEEACWIDLGKKYRVEFQDGKWFSEDEITEWRDAYGIDNIK